MPARAKAAETRGPEVEDEKYYDVKVSATVEYKKVRFGIVSQTQVSGEFLKDLLAAPEGETVTSYAEHS